MNTKLQYRSELYLSDDITKLKLHKIKAKLEKRPLLCGVFLLTLSQNPSNQIEIMQARQLVQDYYSKYPLDVIGIASTYDDAVAIVEKIVQECLHVRGDCALKEYLSC